MLKKRIFILEDDPIIASDLEATLLDLNYEVCAVVHDPFEAKKKIENLLPDLLLLDINLNCQIDGIDLAILIQNLGIDIIFVSAFTDKKTFERVKVLHPLGYIIKPFNEKDIEITLELAFQNKEARTVQKTQTPEQFLFVKSKNNKSVKVNLEDILFIEAFDNYSFLQLDNEKLIVSFTLKELEHKIKAPFLHRVHRSYIVNINKVDGFQYNNLLIQEFEIPIGKSYKDSVLHLFPHL